MTLEQLDSHTIEIATAVGVLPRVVADTFILYATRHAATLSCLGIRRTPDAPTCFDLVMLCIPFDWLEQDYHLDWPQHPWNGAMAVGTGLLCTDDELGAVIRLLEGWGAEIISTAQHSFAEPPYFERMSAQEVEPFLRPYLAEARSADALYRYRIERCPQSFNATVAFLEFRSNITLAIDEQIGSLSVSSYTQAQLSDPLFDPYYGIGVGIFTLNSAGLRELIDILDDMRQQGNWGKW